MGRRGLMMAAERIALHCAIEIRTGSCISFGTDDDYELPHLLTATQMRTFYNMANEWAHQRHRDCRNQQCEAPTRCWRALRAHNHVGFKCFNVVNFVFGRVYTQKINTRAYIIYICDTWFSDGST